VFCEFRGFGAPPQPNRPNSATGEVDEHLTGATDLPSEAAMSEQNKQIARRFLAAFAAADTAVLDQLVTDDIVDHTPSPGQAGGKQGLLAAVTMFRAAFPIFASPSSRKSPRATSLLCMAESSARTTVP